MEYNIKLENIYEGPIALLYDLVVAGKMNIFDIPIGKITEQYIAYLNYLRSIDIEIGSDFIVMAATLMHIKSQMLIPEKVTDTNREREDPRRELIEKLLEYQKFKQAVPLLEEKRRTSAELFFKERKQGLLDFGEEHWIEISLYDLLNAFAGLVSFVEESSFIQIEPEPFTVAMKINFINKQLQNYDGVVFFGDLFSDSYTKLEIVVTFLALLELVKEGSVIIQQHSLFGDIRIVKVT